MSANPNGTRMPRRERHEWVVRLKEQGHTFDEIAQLMGVARSTVLSAYYDPSGDVDRKRKKKFGGVCVDCGGDTTYQTGRPSPRCSECSRKAQKTLELRRQRRWNSPQKWTDDAIFDAIRSVAVDGVASTGAYHAARAEAPESMPSMPLIRARFGRWVDAVEAAGLKSAKGRNSRTDGLTAEGAWLAVEECEIAVGHVPTYNDYTAWAHEVGAPCGTLVRRCVGGWSRVLEREEVA